MAGSFAAQAAAAFQFLVSDHAFGSPAVRRPTVRVPPMVGDDFEEVRFESNKVFVSIWRCPSRLEWDVEVGLLRPKPDQAEAFSVLRDLAVLDAPDRDERRSTSMWPDKLLPKALAERAQALKECGTFALAGDTSLFERLSAARSKRVRAYWRSRSVADATRKAADAFRREDWSEVERLLDPVSTDLSPAQRKKLEYARKRGCPTIPSSSAG
jgi:hypothetical protein